MRQAQFGIGWSWSFAPRSSRRCGKSRPVVSATGLGRLQCAAPSGPDAPTENAPADRMDMQLGKHNGLCCRVRFCC
jgi:hypothetical protein